MNFPLTLLVRKVPMPRYFLILLFFMISCSSSQKKTLVMEAQHDMVVSYKTSDEDKKLTLKQGESFTLESALTKVESANRVPVIIITDTAGLAAASEGGVYKVTLKPVTEWKPKDTEAYIGQELDQLYISLIDALAKAKSRDVGNSINIVNGIIQKYPGMSSAYFIRAQLELLQGKRQDAIKDLDISLQLNPQLMEAKNLRNKIQPKGAQ